MVPVSIWMEPGEISMPEAVAAERVEKSDQLQLKGEETLRPRTRNARAAVIETM